MQLNMQKSPPRLFLEVEGDFKINFETDLEDGKSVEIDMGKINNKDTEDEAYILDKINAAFKSGIKSAAPGATETTAWVGGKKTEKIKLRKINPPIKKKHCTKRKIIIFSNIISIVNNILIIYINND